MIGSFIAAVVRAAFFSLILIVLPTGSIQADSDKIFKDGDTYVELKNAKKLRGASPPFSQPYIIKEEKLSNILRSLYYREKGILGKKGGKKIFNETEIETLVPLITDTLSKANADEYLYVYVPRDRALLDDLETIFCVFVTEDNINLAFSSVRSRSKRMLRSAPRRDRSTKDPTSIKSSGFWELGLGEGHSYKQGHRNWVVINLHEKTFEATPASPLAEREQEKGFEFFAHTNPALEERLRQLEERVGIVSSDGSISGFQPTEDESSSEEGMSLNQKFKDLKELLDDDLISPEEYSYKKKELLKRESKSGGSVPQRLKELRNLLDEGLISDRDYEKKKRELLERL